MKKPKKTSMYVTQDKDDIDDDNSVSNEQVRIHKSMELLEDHIITVKADDNYGNDESVNSLGQQISTNKNDGNDESNDLMYEDIVTVHRSDDDEQVSPNDKASLFGYYFGEKASRTKWK